MKLIFILIIFFNFLLYVQKIIQKSLQKKYKKKAKKIQKIKNKQNKKQNKKSNKKKKKRLNLHFSCKKIQFIISTIPMIYCKIQMNLRK